MKISTLFVWLFLICNLQAQDWTRWRGDESNGTANIRTHLFEHPFELRTRWKRSIGHGYSGIVISDGKAVTMCSDGKSDYLISLTSDDGKEIWRIPLGEAFPPKDGSTGGPVSTPAIDHGVVYALGPRGNLIAANLSTGKLIWKLDLVKELGAAIPHWGFTTSPLIVGNKLIVIVGGINHAIVAFDRSNGKLVWHAGSDDASYQSPILTELNHHKIIVAAGDKFLFGIDPENGKMLWQYEHGGKDFYAKIINPVRVNENGLLLTHKSDESTLLRISDKIEPDWITRELKLNYATPVVYRDLVIGYSGRFLAAVDAHSGEQRWRSRAPGDGFPIVVDDHVVVLTKRGLISVGEATSKEYQEQASLQVLDRYVWTPPSFAEGRIFVRDSYSEIAAVDIVAAQKSDPPTQTMTSVAPAPDWVKQIENAKDPAAEAKHFLSVHPTSPLIEGERKAYIIYEGPETNVTVRSDLMETGVDSPLSPVKGTNLQYAALELEPDARIAYQLIPGLGANAIPDSRNPSKTTALNYGGDVSLLSMPRSELLPVLPSEKLHGKIVELTIESPEVKAEHLKWGGKRNVKVYLPPNYETDVNQHFQTIYVLFGDEMLNAAKLAAFLDREIGSSLPPLIAVFVSTTSAYEMARTFREPHAKMVASQLVPWIEKQFRTISNPTHRILLGADEAGFAAVEIGLRYPNIFGSIIAHSIFALTGGDQELLSFIDSMKESNQRFYIDWGHYDPRRKVDGLNVPEYSRNVYEHLRDRKIEATGREWNEGTTLLTLGQRSLIAIQALLKHS